MVQKRLAMGLVATIALVGCGLLDALPGSGRVTVSSGEHTVHLRFVDEQGLLSSVSREASADLLARVHIFEVAAVPHQPTALDAAWVVTPCDRDLVLHVLGSADEVSALVLDTGMAGVDCEAMGIVYGLRLEFRVSVDALKIDASMLRAGQQFRA